MKKSKRSIMTILTTAFVVGIILPFTAFADTNIFKLTLERFSDAVTIPSHFVIQGRVKVREGLRVARNAVFSQNVNVKGALKNKEGKLKIADVLRVTDNAIFWQDLNVHGVVKNRKDDEPVTIDDDLVVTGNVSFSDGQMDNVTSVRGITGVETAGLEPGDLFFDDTNNKLYVWTGEEFIDLTLDTNTIYSAGTGLKLDNTIFSIPTAAITNALLAGGITYDKLSLANSLTASDILDATISSADISDETITSGDIKDGTINNSDLADDAVKSSKISDGAITSSDLADDSVGASELSGTAIQSGDIGTDDLPTAVTLDNTSETISGNWHFTGDVQMDNLDVPMPDNAALTDQNENITGTWNFLASTSIYQLLINQYAPSWTRNQRVPMPYSKQTLDASNSVGLYTSLTIGRDGFPVIAFYDSVNKDLIFLHCTSLDCSTADTRRTLASDDTSGLFTSIAIGTDGYPIISYQKLDASNNGTLRVIHCTSVDCSSADSARTLDSGGSGITMGGYTSLIIGSDGYPIISYADVTNGKLKVAHCQNTSCSLSGSPLSLENQAGLYSSIGIATDGYPIISYYSHANSDLKVIHCLNNDCSSLETAKTIDSSGEVGAYTSLSIGDDGYPIISYYDSSNGDLKAVHCTTYNCSSYDSPVKLDSNGIVGWHTSLTIGRDGYANIAYYDSSNEDLKVVHCLNQACSKNTTPRAIDSTAKVGQYASMAISVDGIPVIAYYDGTNYDVKVYKASNQYFLDYWTRR